jgi:uncharacterized repeat protein (TIGR01451 family)
VNKNMVFMIIILLKGYHQKVNMVERKNVVILFLSLAFIFVFLGFASACTDPCGPPTCNLKLTKSVNSENAEVGDILTYTLHYKNIGNSICTGSGVKIQDILDENLLYTGTYTKSVLNDVDHQGINYGWEGIVGYNALTRTLIWNANTVSPNEEGTITFDVKVLEPQQCGDFEISNYFKAWSLEERWKDSNSIAVSVNNDCPPTCGDYVCNGDETCSSCSDDCGACPSCTLTINNPLAGNYYRDSILLSWTPSDTCKGVKYDLYYKQGNCDLSDGWLSIQDFVQATSYSWLSGLNGENYCFRVEEDNNQASATTSGLFGIDNTAPIIISPDRTCNEGETITLTASASDALSGVDSSTWKWDKDNNGIYETNGQTTSYLCENSGVKTVSVKVSDNAGNSANKNVAITINPLPPTCNHDVDVKYSFGDTFNTGIGISENNVWLNNPVILDKDKTHSIKYKIENKKDVDDNVNVVLKVDGNILSEYDNLINIYHIGTYNLDISSLTCNTYHTISVEVESDGEECDLTNNYASRQFYVDCGVVPPTPVCDLTNAHWSTSSTLTGNVVSLIVDGSNCNGKIINFQVYQYKSTGDAYITNTAIATFTTNTGSVSSNWVAVAPSENDGDTTPTYYFIANVLGFSENDKSGNLDVAVRPIPPTCGDSICNGAETCSTCSSDCGICPTPIPPTPKKETFSPNSFTQYCNTNWICSAWSECSDGAMTRECTDKNHCDVEYNKPYEQTDCKNLSKVYVEEFDSNKFWIIVGIILFIVLLIILINML